MSKQRIKLESVEELKAVLGAELYREVADAIDEGKQKTNGKNLFRNFYCSFCRFYASKFSADQHIILSFYPDHA